MNRDTALRILGLSDGASRDQVAQARRRLLAALHPDKHPGGDKEIFDRLVCDITEAARTLTSGPAPSGSGPRPTDSVESVLFDIRASESWNRAKVGKGEALARFDGRYASDKILAVGILGLDPRFAWFSTNGLTGQRDNRLGTALYLVAWNRTRRRVEGLDIEKGFLIDNLGNQYSSDGSFYWADASESFHRHSADIAPSAKLDGFLLYPPLRVGAGFFSRWFLYDSFSVSDKYISGEYDVELPSAPQRAAALLVGGEESVAGETEDDGSEINDDGDLDDEWLYGEDDSQEHEFIEGICVNCGLSADEVAKFGSTCE